MLSKTLAEEAAWKFSKENGIDMVTVHPGWVLGPLLQPTLNLSVENYQTYQWYSSTTEEYLMCCIFLSYQYMLLSQERITSIQHPSKWLEV